jgi:ABC-type cobalamin transport system permease subunit
MKTMSDRRDDLPKTVAVVTVSLSSLAIRSGFAYLRMKRRARRSSKLFERGLVSSGIPPSAAHQLAMRFETDLSIRNMIGRFGGSFTRLGRSRSEDGPPAQPGQ